MGDRPVAAPRKGQQRHGGSDCRHNVAAAEVRRVREAHHEINDEQGGCAAHPQLPSEPLPRIDIEIAHPGIRPSASSPGNSTDDTPRADPRSGSTSAVGQPLPVRQGRTRVSSTPNNCRSRCTATNFRVVPQPDSINRKRGTDLRHEANTSVMAARSPLKRPMDVVEAAGIPAREKPSIFKAWETDEGALQRAEGEGMGGGEHAHRHAGAVQR